MTVKDSHSTLSSDIFKPQKETKYIDLENLSFEYVSFDQ